MDLLLEAFTFALIGMQLPWVVRDVIASDQGLRHGIAVSLVVLLVAILVRPLYIVGTARFDHLRLRGSHRPPRDSLTAARVRRGVVGRDARRRDARRRGRDPG